MACTNDGKQQKQGPANPNTGAHEGHNHTSEAETYTCPMHPQIVQKEPGTCPICGMDLVKKAALGGMADSLQADAQLSALLKPTNSVVVANMATVQPEARREAVETQANGIVTYDTRRLYTIPARFGGRVERLYVRYNFQPIRKGQKLLELYSPDLVTAQSELVYLLEADTQNAPLIAAAKQKLRLLGLTDSQLTDLVRTRKPNYSLAVYSPYDGYVVSQNTTVPVPAPPTGMVSAGGSAAGMSGGMAGGTDEVTFGTGSAASPTPGGSGGAAASGTLLREGQYVQTGETLFRVVNPNRLWAEFRLYSVDAAGVRPGTPLTISFDGTGLAKQSARVSFVVPFIENGSQFVTIRAYLPRQQGIRVGQLTRATVRRPAVDGLWVPATAILDLGNQQVAFVKEGGAFRPVTVSVAGRSRDQVAVRRGLQADQEVARNAQFLIDSESFVNVSSEN
nr:efflux RND transporter periplasmic adaptor subunit [Fibrella aestuarina]